MILTHHLGHSASESDETLSELKVSIEVELALGMQLCAVKAFASSGVCLQFNLNGPFVLADGLLIMPGKRIGWLGMEVRQILV